MRRPPRTPRLRRSDCSGPGLQRAHRGRGFIYLDSDGQRVDDPDTLERVRALGIPPAWKEVWICSDPRGHLQATGIDAAGRKQYLYHAVWRELRDRQKFATMEEFAAALPTLRREVAADLAAGDGPTRERVLACAARMLDVGLFRIGGEEYAKEEGGVGLATLRPEHVKVSGGRVAFDYPAKSGVLRHYEMSDSDVVSLLGTLKRRRGGPEQLLAYRTGRTWCGLHSDDISDYVKAHLGDEFSAKDFRTWNATVLAAVFIGQRAGDRHSKTSSKRLMSAISREVAEHLGNTPAVARRSYIDPRVFDRFLGGRTIRENLTRIEALEDTPENKRRQIELAVLDLLADHIESPRVEVHEPVAA